MWRQLLFSLVCAVFACSHLGAQEPPDKEQVRQQRLAAMRQIAERFTVQTTADIQTRGVPLIESPILRFNDPAREFHDATLWAWGDKGRPVCLLAIEQYGNQSWLECISLAEETVTLAADADKLQWRPQTAGLELAAFPDAPPPAKSAPRRMAQMKELLEKLSVHEVGKTGSRYELRLMPRALYRYDNPEDELQDGAIFAFAFGTNPELLAVIEAHGTEEDSQWQVGFVRCGTAEPHVLLDKMELFTLPYARGTRPSDPYWNFSYRFGEKK